MTTTDPDTAAPQPEAASGADLARMAFQAARLAAKNRGATPAKPTSIRSRRKPVRGDGREPLTFAAALTALMESRGWQAPVAGGTLVDRWPDIAPELAGHVHVGRFDAESGVLELVPASPAYATQLRLSSGALVTRINAALHDGQDQQQQARGQALVRSIRVLAPGSGQTVQAAQTGSVPADPSEPAEVGPARTREGASAGYRQALAAHQAKKSGQPDPVRPAVRAAIERQEQALRARRELEQVFADGQALHEPVRPPESRDSRAAALERARQDKAGRLPGVPRLFGAA
jgi:hypothetical protein